MLSYCVCAGLSVSEFYDAELWEVTAILRTYFAEKEQEYKERYNVARFQMGAMVDTEKIKFAWERPSIEIDELDEDRKAKIEETNKRLDARAKEEFKAIDSLIDLGYTKQEAKDAITKVASRTKKVVEFKELVKLALNG